jgi:hypothetical protein
VQSLGAVRLRRCEIRHNRGGAVEARGDGAVATLEGMAPERDLRPNGIGAAIREESGGRVTVIRAAAGEAEDGESAADAEAPGNWADAWLGR